MALTKAKVREILSAAGVDGDHMSDAVDAIISGHVASIDALREDVSKYKAEADKLVDIQKELDELKTTSADSAKTKEKYDSLKKEYAEYKAQQAEKETAAKKRSAYRQLLKEVGVSEKRIDTVLKVSDFGSIEFDDGGKVKGADKLKESLAEEWKEFIETTEKHGAPTENPPSGGEGSKNPPTRAAQLSKQFIEDRYGKTEEAK